MRKADIPEALAIMEEHWNEIAVNQAILAVAAYLHQVRIGHEEALTEDTSLGFTFSFDLRHLQCLADEGYVVESAFIAADPPRWEVEVRRAALDNQTKLFPWP